MVSKFLIFLLFLSANHVLAADIIKAFKTTGLTKQEQKALNKVAREINQLLPEKIKKEVPHNMSITFQTLNNISIPKPHCEAVDKETALKLSNIKYGTLHSSKNNIIISKQLLSQYEDGSKHTYPCRHGNLRKRLLGVVLHEIFHVYDKNNKSRKEDREVEGCPIFDKPLGYAKYNNAENRKCIPLHRQAMRRLRVSHDMVFKGQSFWRSNKKNTRIPDPYENYSKEEYAAVNFEYFILDREYQCRRPMQYHYFAREFSYTPFSDTQCPRTVKVLTSNERSKKEFVPLNLDRVYQVHYLYVEKGLDMAANFGHSLIHLVICAPERRSLITGNIIPATPYGPQCLNDVDYHLVASFYAEILDLNQSITKGLFGGYDSLLGMLDLQTVIKKYNKVQMRNMYSLPLNYTDDQKELFLKNMLNVHWEYRNNYKFITNNCATETLQLLVSPFNRAEYYLGFALTPGGVLKRLIKFGLIDKYYVENNYENLNSLNIFKSNAHYLNIAYENIFPQVKDTDKAIVEKYIEKKATERRLVLEKLENNGNKREWKKKIKSFILLERQARTYFEFNFWQYFLKEVSGLIKDKELLNKIAKAGKSVIALTGYGIPQESEWLSLEGSFKNPNQKEVIEELLKGSEDIIKPYQEEYRAEQLAIEANLERARELLN